MKIVGITGSVATGKTTVARMFSSLLKAEIIDADKIAHKFLCPGEKTWEEVVQYFGKEILKDSSYIDRKKLGQEIFSNPCKRKKLESIIHPSVKKIIKDKLNQLRKSNREWVVVDIPLLFEAKMENMVDKIIVVVRKQKAQIETLRKEKGLSLKEAKQRIESQLPLAEKAKKAHFIVDNNGTFKDTECQVKQISTNLKTKNKQSKIH